MFKTNFIEKSILFSITSFPENRGAYEIILKTGTKREATGGGIMRRKKKCKLHVG
jgi:hypothetical protein